MRRLTKLEESYFGLFRGQETKDKGSILGISGMSDNERQCKVIYRGNSVISATKFYKNDIIEVCPTREISKHSLYTRDVRDLVLEVIPNSLYVIPFGYCQHYDVVDRNHPTPNCDYEWDDSNHTIVIRALCSIPKNSVLVLNMQK